MDIVDFTSQIESEVSIRLLELGKLNNLCNLLENVDEKNSLRRASICLYYAHIEGFVYFIFTHYINAINMLVLPAKNVINEIKAANYHKNLSGLLSNKKHPLFKKPFPEDQALHTLFRQAEFLSEILPSWNQAIINIDDSFIDTENNVGKEVLQKLLYKVGLNYQAIDQNLCSDLARLLRIRNDIAHGSNLSIIKDDDFENYYVCVTTIISKLRNIIIDAYRTEAFLVQPSNP